MTEIITPDSDVRTQYVLHGGVNYSDTNQYERFPTKEAAFTEWVSRWNFHRTSNGDSCPLWGEGLTLSSPVVTLYDHDGDDGPYVVADWSAAHVFNAVGTAHMEAERVRHEQTATTLRAEITRLLASLGIAQGEAREARDRHEREVTMIGNKLMAEARRRAWCSEYDDFVDGLNCELTYTLPLRYQNYTVERVFTVTLTHTVRSEANGEDEVYDEWNRSMSAWDLGRQMQRDDNVAVNVGDPEVTVSLNEDDD